MAGPPCMSEDGNVAVFVGTFLETGQPVSLCDACLVPWAAAMLQAMTGVDPAPFIAAISEDTAAAAAAAGAPTDEPPAPAPADTDDDAGSDDAAGEVASWVDSGDPPPVKAGSGGRTSRGRSSGVAVTGGERAGDDDDA